MLDLKPSRSSRYKQGYIDPRTCTKLLESQSAYPVIYRSSYERKFITWLETCSEVKVWGSECIIIPYTYIDGKVHCYYPDYFIEMVDGRKYVVEIKPSNQAKAPAQSASVYARKEWSKNYCKWKAAKEYCAAKGYIFQIVTEKTLNKL